MHVNELRERMAAGNTASQHTLLKAAVALGHVDTTRVYVQCEAPGCTANVQVSEVFSLALVYRMPGRGVNGFQCADEQHFGCSHDHAVAAMVVCLKEHIEPTHRALQRQK